MSKALTCFSKRFERNSFVKFIYYHLFNPKLRFSKIDLAPYKIFRLQKQPWTVYRTTAFNENLNEVFNRLSLIREDEYLYHITLPVIIEPYYGWIIFHRKEVIKQSLPYGVLEKTPLPHFIFYQKKKTVKVEKAVSMRYNWFNYWHFYNDILGQLYLLDREGFDKKIPLVIPKKALDLGYVKEFFTTAFAKTWNWVFQDQDTFIELKSVYLCKSIPNIREHFIYAAAIFKNNTVSGNRNLKIFVTRKPERGRFLHNWAEISALLKKYDFDIVECDDLSLEQQIKVFESAKVVVGIHGAGLTNIIYRYPHPCVLIEIFPPNLIATHYYWLAKELNFKYQAILGENLHEGAFDISSQRLLSTIINSQI